MKHYSEQFRVGILHGAGYVGRELIKLIEDHPRLCLSLVSSSSFAGQPVVSVHPGLRGKISKKVEAMKFSEFAPAMDSDKATKADQILDVIISCARHGSGAGEVEMLLKDGFKGLIIDMSADLRFPEKEYFENRFGRPHPAPHLLKKARYGLSEIHPVAPGTSLIANPGCFATGIALALHPLRGLNTQGAVGITAFTGASGSGAVPTSSTHFPDRDGNVKSYKVLEHDHELEAVNCLNGDFDVSFVPVSGPFTRGIWGSVHVSLGDDYSSGDIASVFNRAYSASPFVRLWEDELPQLHLSVETPFCDLGWVLQGRKLIVGFALDNLLKGAASQAIQNLNLSLGLDVRLGLLPESSWTEEKVMGEDVSGIQSMAVLSDPDVDVSQLKSASKSSMDKIRHLEDRFEITTYNRWPISLEVGTGSTVIDAAGTTYLDFYGGHCVTLLGHNHPAVVAAIKKQADRLIFYSNVVYNGVRAEAASKLIDMAGEGFSQVFFCNSGTEANETALKIARKMTGRRTVIAMENGFHGRTLGSLAATWNPAYREPYFSSAADTVFIPFNDLNAVKEVFQSTPDVAAVILEPIQSMGGVAMIDPDYVREVRSLCDANGAQLIFDEIQTGVGRTGTFLYSEKLGIKPDLTTLAKSLASGVPIGAVLMTETIAKTISPGDQGTTFGGGMLAMAAMNATLAALETEDGLVAATRIYDQIEKGLASESVEVLGAGCLIGLRFERPVSLLCIRLRERNILVGGSADPNVMRLMPPLVVTPAEVDHFLAELRQILNSDIRNEGEPSSKTVFVPEPALFSESMS